MGNNGIAVYDNGYYNTGVRPTLEDIGVGGTDPFGNPLSEVGFCEQALQQGVACTIVNQNQNGPVANASVANLVNGRAGEGIGPAPLRPACPAGTPSSTATCDRINVLGAFKTPGLRNVELTGPYMHNGGMATLQQVVEFYDRGGDFAQQNMDNLDPNILPLHLTAEQRDDLVQFLVALTDERVRWQRAPFDHPELCFPNGDFGDQSAVAPDPVLAGAGRDQVLCSPAAGAAGAALPLQPFFTPGPFVAPTPTPAGAIVSAPTPATSAPTPATGALTPLPTMVPTPHPTSAQAPLPTSTPVAVATDQAASSAAAASHRTGSGSASPRAKVSGSPAPVVSAAEAAAAQESQTIDVIPRAASQTAAPPVVSAAEAAAPLASQTIDPTTPLTSQMASSPPPVTPTPLATPAPISDPAAAADDASAVSVGPAAPTPSMVSASIDPAVGGVVMTIDGAVSVTVPAGATSDTLVVSLGADQGVSNLRLGGRLYLLNAQDSLGDNVTSFDQPLIVTQRRSAAAVAPGDLRARLSALLDADSGAFQSMPTTVHPDGSLTMSVDRLAPIVAETAAPADPSASAETPVDVPIPSNPTDDASLAAVEASRTGDRP